jgi:hypothetical protein
VRNLLLTLRVERTLLSAAFDFAFDSNSFSYIHSRMTTAVSTTVEERRFSAAQSVRVERRFSAAKKAPRMELGFSPRDSKRRRPKPTHPKSLSFRTGPQAR